MRNATSVWIVSLLTVLIVAGPAMAQRADVDQLTAAQKQLLAARAARADAIRKLAEQIKGIRITSETTVKDFVTESDRIHTYLGPVILRGAREVGKPRFYANGICEVTMQVTLMSVMKELKGLHAAHYKGSKYKSLSFEQWKVYNKLTTITAVGSGAQPASAQDVQQVVPPGSPPGTPAVVTWRTPPGWERVAPNGYNMAKRAARMDAMRKLAERIRGISITSETTVKDFVTERDMIHTFMKTFMRGFKEEGPAQYLPNQTAQVTLSITLQQVVNVIKGLQVIHKVNDDFKSMGIDRIKQQVRTGKFIESGYGAVHPKFILAPVPVVQGVVGGPKPPAWVGSPVQAVGNSSISAQKGTDPAQKQLLAMRAAELDAKRKLGETVWGLKINATTTVKDFVATSDVIRGDLYVFLAGARIVATDVQGDIVSVTVEIDPKNLWDNVIKQRLGN